MASRPPTAARGSVTTFPSRKPCSGPAVPAGMAVQGLQRHRGRPRLGGTLRQLVQWRALAQRHPLRRAQHAACRTRSHRAGRARLPLDKGARGKARTVVRTAAQLGASRSRLAKPRARHRLPQNKRRRMNLTDNSFDKHPTEAARGRPIGNQKTDRLRRPMRLVEWAKKAVLPTCCRRGFRRLPIATSNCFCTPPYLAMKRMSRG